MALAKYAEAVKIWGFDLECFVGDLGGGGAVKRARSLFITSEADSGMASRTTKAWPVDVFRDVAALENLEA